jgi:hypothetical protein
VVVAKLAFVNTKRIVRNKGLKIALVVLPLVIALLRIIFAGSKPILLAAQLCPIACALLLCVALYSQWSMDTARGLIAGFHSSPVSSRGLVVSRVLSGALILLAQMAVFCAILAIRF